MGLHVSAMIGEARALVGIHIAGEFPARLAEDVAAVQTGNLEKAVGDISEAQILVHFPEPVRGRFRDVAQALLAFPP